MTAWIIEFAVVAVACCASILLYEVMWRRRRANAEAGEAFRRGQRDGMRDARAPIVMNADAWWDGEFFWRRREDGSYIVKEGVPWM
jgi:hypothetical protein